MPEIQRCWWCEERHFALWIDGKEKPYLLHERCVECPSIVDNPFTEEPACFVLMLIALIDKFKKVCRRIARTKMTYKIIISDRVGILTMRELRNDLWGELRRDFRRIWW
jgi:hypothetical protein